MQAAMSFTVDGDDDDAAEREADVAFDAIGAIDATDANDANDADAAAAVSFELPDGRDFRKLSVADILALEPHLLPPPPRGRPRKGSVQELLAKKKIYKMLKFQKLHATPLTNDPESGLNRKYGYVVKYKREKEQAAVVSDQKHVNYRAFWSDDALYQYATRHYIAASDWRAPPQPAAVASGSLRDWVAATLLAAGAAVDAALSEIFAPVRLSVAVGDDEDGSGEGEQPAAWLAPFSGRCLIDDDAAAATAAAAGAASIGNCALNACAPVTALTLAQAADGAPTLVVGTSRVGWPRVAAGDDYELRTTTTTAAGAAPLLTPTHVDGFASDFLRPLHAPQRHDNLLQLWRAEDAAPGDVWRLDALVALRRSGAALALHAHVADASLVAVLQGDGRVRLLALGDVPPAATRWATVGDARVFDADALQRGPPLSAARPGAAHAAWVTAFAWCPARGARCVTGHSDGSVGVWDVAGCLAAAPGAAPTLLSRLGDAAAVDARSPVLAAVTALAFAPYALQAAGPAATLLAAGAQDGVVRLWQLPVDGDGDAAAAPAAAPTGGDRPQPLAALTLNVACDVSALQWDPTGHGLFFASGESAEVGWLRLWSALPARRNGLLGPLNARNRVAVAPHGRATAFVAFASPPPAAAAPATVAERSVRAAFDTDGASFVYGAGSDGCLRGGFAMTTLLPKEPHEDGFALLQVLAARRLDDAADAADGGDDDGDVAAAAGAGRVRLRCGFNVRTRPLAAPGRGALDDDNDDAAAPAAAPAAKRRRTSGARRAASDDDSDADADGDSDEPAPRRPKAPPGRPGRQRDVACDSRVALTALCVAPHVLLRREGAALRAAEAAGEHVAVCGLQSGLVVALPPRHLLDAYDVAARHRLSAL